MPDLEELSRVVYGHQWDSVQHWASAIGALAELSDDELAALPRLAPAGYLGARNRALRG